MAVKTAEPVRFSDEKFALSDVDGSVDTEVLGIRRNQAGDWAVDLEVNVKITLPDGRQLITTRRLAVSHIVQLGRKPREGR